VNNLRQDEGGEGLAIIDEGREGKGSAVKRGRGSPPGFLEEEPRLALEEVGVLLQEREGGKGDRSLPLKEGPSGVKKSSLLAIWKKSADREGKKRSCR